MFSFFLVGCLKRFCYARFLPLDEQPAFVVDFANLSSIGVPAVLSEEFNYMEDSQVRNNFLQGFELNNRGLSGAAGYTYLGQFLSHDINLDETSVLRD